MKKVVHDRPKFHTYVEPAVAVVDRGVVSLCNFASILLLAKYLSSMEFGVFMLFYPLLSLTTSIISLAVYIS